MTEMIKKSVSCSGLLECDSGPKTNLSFLFLSLPQNDRFKPPDAKYVFPSFDVYSAFAFNAFLRVLRLYAFCPHSYLDLT